MARAGPPSDPVAAATSWAAALGVEVRRWPGDGDRPGAGASGPVLYLVEPEATPPERTPTQDWVRLPLDLDEVPARCERLLAIRSGASQQLQVDDDGLARFGGEVRVLSPMDVRLIRLLLARPGAVVSHRAIAEALWPDADEVDPRAVHGPVKRLRERLAGIPVELESVWRRGVRLVPHPEEVPDGSGNGGRTG
jgi:hypothetical protein